MVAVLRAGLGMLDTVIDLIPVARVGFVGLYRDEHTLQPVEYYSKLPGDMEERDVLMLDPMLATGGSAAAALTECARQGARRMSLLSIVAAPEGLERVAAAHPDVTVYTVAGHSGVELQTADPARAGRRRRSPVRYKVRPAGNNWCQAPIIHDNHRVQSSGRGTLAWR